MNKEYVLEKLAQAPGSGGLDEEFMKAWAREEGRRTASGGISDFEKAKATEAGKRAAGSLKDEYRMAWAREAGKMKAAPKPTFFGEFKTKGLPLIATGAALMTIFFAADQIIDYLEKKGKAVKSKEYFQAMLKAHPQLQAKDPKIVAQYWESLYHFNPGMAEDPLASGAWITQATRSLSGLELGGPAPDSYATLTQIAKQLKESKSSNKINSSEFILPDVTRGLLSLG